MAVTQWVAKFEQNSVDQGNYQIVDFHFNPVGSPTLDQQAAQIAMYLVAVGHVAMAEGTRLVELSYRVLGTPGFTPIAFPVAAKAALDAVADGAIIWIDATYDAYSEDLGEAGVLCPLGTSISVSERTAHSGPTGRGRHFLPFVGADAVDGAGAVGSAGRTAIEKAANYCLRAEEPNGDSAASPFVDLNPVVTNAAQTTNYPITVYKAQPVFSNLESRRR